MGDDLVSKELDKSIAAIAEAIAGDEIGMVIVDTDRMNDILYSKEVISKIVDGDSVKITHKLHEPFNSVGSVLITGKEIIILDTDAFDKVADIASNFEVYPKTNGTVVMTFTFHGLVKKE